MGHQWFGCAVRAFKMMDEADSLATLHLRSQVEADFKNAGLGREQVILAMQRLRENRRRLAKFGARLLSPLERAQADQHVSQTTLRDAMHMCRDAFATPHFRGNHDFALVLRL